MGFQDVINQINWKVHFASPIENVFEALTTDEGRKTFWAESTNKKMDTLNLHFSITLYTCQRSWRRNLFIYSG